MRSDNIRMLEDTLRIIESGSYRINGNEVKLKLSMDEILTSTVLLPKDVKDICDNPIDTKINANDRTSTICTNEDSFAAAIKIKNAHKNDKVLVLNFASPVHPGGGVRNGANAQEEDLCRKSSLILSLEGDSARAYYDYNKTLDTYMGSDAIILTPNVEIIKDSNGMLLDESFVVSVMTCAAPMISRGLEGMTKGEYEDMLYNRIVGMLKVAVNYGYKYLVLGAWGCGVFGNDALDVAKLFYKALKEIKYNNKPLENMFEQLFFAVLDRSFDKYNFNTFYKYFDYNNFNK